MALANFRAPAPSTLKEMARSCALSRRALYLMIDRLPRVASAARRSRFAFLVAVSFLGAAFAPPATLASSPADAAEPTDPSGSCKPLPPIDVQIVPLDGISPGGVGRFRLDVTPRIPAREVRVRWVRSSDRVLWVSGDSLATRPTGLETSHSFQVALRVPDAGLETLHCQVEMVSEGGQIWRRGVGLALGPEAVRARGRLAPDGEGGHFIEFDAAPADHRPEGSR